MAIRLNAGDEIHEGRVFRRIPNWKSRFSPATGRPKIGVFRPAPEDHGELSCHLEALMSQDTILALMDADPQLRVFGLCALDVRRIAQRVQGGTRAIFNPDPEDPVFGRAHVYLPYLDNPGLQAVLLELSEVIRPPTVPLQ